MDSSPSSLRKAAILIDSLDARSADALLEQMPERTAAQVRQAVMELPDIPAEERRQIIAEFLGREPERLANQESGVELQVSAAAYEASAYPPGHSTSRQPPATARIEPSPHASSSIDPLSSSGDQAHRRGAPFAFLQQATPETLTGFLQKEHPQVVALILAHLAPLQAAEVLGQLSQDLQCDVLRRIADLDTADPEILGEVEREIESLLSDHLRLVQRRSEGLAAIHAILSAAQGGQRQRLLTRLKDYDQNLAGQLEQLPPATSFPADRPSGHTPPSYTQGQSATDAKHSDRATPTQRGSANTTRAAAPHPDVEQASDKTTRNSDTSQRSSTPETPVTSARSDRPASAPRTQAVQPRRTLLPFTQLERLSNLALAKLFGRAEPQIAILALTGAPPQFVDRLLKQLPPKSARHLRTKMENLGPLRLSDVEQAQQQLSQLASELIAEGTIGGPPGGTESAPPPRFAAAA